jgi:hypothetical protein
MRRRPHDPAPPARALAAIAALALAAAACGGSSASDERPAAATPDMSRYGPTHAVAGARTPAPPKFPAKTSPSVAQQLQAGVVGVQAFGGEVLVRPASLDTSSDGGMVGVRWSAWGATSASGAGSFSVNDCQPNCATGHPKRVPATVQLSQVTVCDGRRYFSRAVITPASGAAPASYVRAPC